MAKYQNVQKAAFWSADSDEGKTKPNLGEHDLLAKY